MGEELKQTREHLQYDRWFMACSSFWDQFGFEEAYDHTYLPWEKWYADGLTVEQAVRLAHREVFGQDLPV